MQPTTDRSLRELQRETEQTRAGLTHTVEQLKSSVTDTANEIRQRISPENIKAEVSDYVRSRGESDVGGHHIRCASKPDAGGSRGRQPRISPA